MSHARNIFLFTTYSSLFYVLHALLNLMPHFMRVWIWGRLLGALGAGALIDTGVYFRYPSKIRFGHHVAINRDCQFYASHRAEGGTITVGDHVAFGPGVRIFAAGHDHTLRDLPDIAKSVVIGDHAWIGGSSIILHGVTIGEGAVIGAGSVVTRDIAAYTIAAGNPARALKPRVLADEPQT